MVDWYGFPGNCCIIRANAIPIPEYKIVHTGPKIRLGGVHNGSCILRYHVLVARKTKGMAAHPPNTCNNAQKRHFMAVTVVVVVDVVVAAEAIVETIRGATTACNVVVDVVVVVEVKEVIGTLPKWLGEGTKTQRRLLPELF